MEKADKRMKKKIECTNDRIISKVQVLKRSPERSAKNMTGGGEVG